MRPQLNLKNVIFQRDNLQEKLHYALQELETLRVKQSQLQMQLQTFDDDEDFEKMYENFARMDKDHNRPSLGGNDTIVDTEAVIQQLDDLLSKPKETNVHPDLLDDDDDEMLVPAVVINPIQPKPASSGKPKFSLALGGVGGGAKPSAVPNLDFSNLKHVKENDWYAQSRKLEEVIAKLRARVSTYEEEKSELVQNNQAQEKLLRQLQR